MDDYDIMPIVIILVDFVLPALVIVGFRYIHPWVTKTKEKKKIEGLNRYMGRQVLHIEEDKSKYCYCWDFDFEDISDRDYKEMLQYCIRHNLKVPAELLSKHTKKDISDLEQKS